MNVPEQPTPANDPFGMSRFSPRRYSVQHFTLLIAANILGVAILAWAAAAREPLLISLSAAMTAVMAGMTVLVFWVGVRTIAVEAWIRRLGMGDLEYRIEPWGRDEVSKACMALEALRQSSIKAMQLDLVTQLSQEVQQKNDELEGTLAELRRTQDQLVSQQKLTELGQLVGAIAHELSNPVNLISNFAGSSRELMEELGESLGQEEKSREILAELGGNMRSIENSCGRASRIVQDASRLGQERQSVLEPVEVNPLVRAHVHHTLETAKQRNPGAVTPEVSEDLDPAAGVIPAVAADLGRVVALIAGNALEAMGERAEWEGPGSGYQATLEVRTRRTEGHVEVAFRDNGTGIPAEVMPRIFNPFFTTRTGNRGAGLGLSLTHDIVREHGGEITVDSELGRYTEVTVRIPA